MSDESPAEITEHPLFVDLPLYRACAYSDDAGVEWHETMPVVLAGFPQITVADYWNLTVGQHVYLLRFLTPKSPKGSEPSEMSDGK